MSSKNISRSKRLSLVTIGSLAAMAPIGASFASTASAAPASTTTSASASTVLSAIKYCESTNNYSVVNSIGAGGAYQFMPATWRGLGYSGLPQNASPATQDAAAMKLYAQQGTDPWVSSQACWAPKLASGNVPNTISTTSASTKATTKASSNATASRSNVRTNITTPTTNTASSTLTTEAHGDLIARDDIKLSDAETKAIEAIEAQQKTLPTWTKQAASGKTIIRHSVQASGLTTYTHTEANFASAQKDVIEDGEALSGHYVNVDWFQITAGEHAGQYVSTATLTRHGNDVVQHGNGTLPKAALTVLPSWLSADGDQLNPTVAKQLILMNAAFRADTGSNLSITQGYRALAEQHHLRATLSKALAANPGDSNHGFGEAIDFATTFNPATKAGLANLTWMKNNAALFGFAHPSNINSIETWHYDFQG